MVPITFSELEITRFAAEDYCSLGVPESDAELIAQTLCQADLWGHQSHGVRTTQSIYNVKVFNK